jgi:hypothetical protein
MTEPLSVVSIGSIITSHTLIFRKYRNKEIPRSNYQKKEWAKKDLTASLCSEKLFSSSCESNSLKFRPVKWKNYKSPK